MSDTANDLNIDLITSSYISKESSGSALNDSIAANINNIDAIADKLGGDYELAGKVQNAVYANISDYGNKSLALQDRGALETTKDFAVNTIGKGLIGGTLSGIGGALGTILGAVYTTEYQNPSLFWSGVLKGVSNGLRVASFGGSLYKLPLKLPTPVVSTAIGQVVSKGLTGAVKLSRHLLSNYQKESKLVYFAHG